MGALFWRGSMRISMNIRRAAGAGRPSAGVAFSRWMSCLVRNGRAKSPGRGLPRLAEKIASIGDAWSNPVADQTGYGRAILDVIWSPRRIEP